MGNQYNRGVFNVIPSQAGIQSIQLTAFWIALTLHCVSRLRWNDEGFKLVYSEGFGYLLRR